MNRLKRAFGFSILTGTMFLLPSCAEKGVETPPPSVLAQVNGKPITEATFRHWWAKKLPSRDSVAAREQLLDRLIERSIIAERAREAGILDDPEVANTIESLLISRLKERELFPLLKDLEVTEKEARNIYERVADQRFAVPGRLRVAVLWSDTRGREQRENRYLPGLEEVHHGILNGVVHVPVGEGFGKFSIRTTEHRASRYRGGVLDWLEVGRTYDPWRNAVLNIAESLTEPGELSSVVANDAGLFLVRLIERRERSLRKFEAVKGTLVSEVRSARRREIEKIFVEELRDGIEIRRFSNHLTALSDLPKRSSPFIPDTLGMNP